MFLSISALLTIAGFLAENVLRQPQFSCQKHLAKIQIPQTINSRQHFIIYAQIQLIQT